MWVFPSYISYMTQDTAKALLSSSFAELRPWSEKDIQLAIFQGLQLSWARIILYLTSLNINLTDRISKRGFFMRGC